MSLFLRLSFDTPGQLFRGGSEDPNNFDKGPNYARFLNGSLLRSSLAGYSFLVVSRRNLDGLPTGSGWTLSRGGAINNSGEIIGYGTGRDGQQCAFLLNTNTSAAREPSSFALFGPGIAVLTLVGRRMSSVRE